MKTTLKENFFDLDESTWDGVLTEDEHDTVLQAINEEKEATVLSRELVVNGGETDYYNVEIAGVVIPGLHGVHINNIEQFVDKKLGVACQYVVDINFPNVQEGHEIDHDRLEQFLKFTIDAALKQAALMVSSSDKTLAGVEVSDVVFETDYPIPDPTTR